MQDTTLIEQTSSIPIALTTPFMNPVNEEVFIKHVLTLEDEAAIERINYFNNNF